MNRSGFLVCALIAVAISGAASLACAATGRSPDSVLQEWPSWPTKVACGPKSPAFYPDVALRRPADAENGSRPPEIALRTFLREHRQPGPQRHGWRLLAVDHETADFIHGDIEDPSTELIAVSRHAGTWHAEFRYDGLCEFHAARGHRIATSWGLVDGRPLKPSTRSIEVFLGNPDECNSVAIEPPEFRRENGVLLMTLWLHPLPHHHLACTEEELFRPIKIHLPRPLGQLKLYDGGIFPPVAHPEG